MPSEKGLGVQKLLRANVSGSFPFSYVETAGGLLLMANGIDPMMKWDGLALRASTAGIIPPDGALELGGTGLGYITGKLVAYSRFLDANGNVSDLSPISNLVDFGRDGFVEDVNWDTTTGKVTVMSYAHGLVTGDAVAIDQSDCLPQLNGRWTITRADDDTFTINNLSIASGYYTGGAIWTMGIQSVVYGAVPVPVDSNVVRRQILRNLAGNLEVLYVDVDTTDLTTTAFSSQATDAILAAGEPVPLTYGEDDLPYANRHGLPPSHKSVLVAHKGRIFAAVDVTYTEGHVEAAFNSDKVQGVGTNWSRSFVGRMIYIDGATKPYSIAAVDETNQIIALANPFLEAPSPYARYAIRSEPGEQRLLYYSEPGLPESWPVYNALAVPETDDDIKGLVAHGQYLYVFETRHVHRLTSQSDPHTGFVFLTAHRGIINSRMYAEVDGNFYCMDEIGIHVFSEEGDKAISLPVQNLFQNDGTQDLRVDWTADQTLWHAALDPVRDTVRFFVQMVGYSDLHHALCYNYRTERWWIEEYPTAMTANAVATFGARRSLCGTDARRVVCLGEGAYDGVQIGGGTLRGTVTSADTTHLTDTAASFDAVEGAPVTIVAGTGRGQSRVIATVQPTQLEVVQPWDAIPDTTSVYQIGGIQWLWRSGWFRFLDSEEEIPRDVELVFRPTTLDTLIDFQLYFDHSPTPRTWNRSIEQDGITTVDGDPHITVNVGQAVGWARQRLAGHSNTNSFGDRFVSVELSGVQSGEPVRISQVVITGVEE